MSLSIQGFFFIIDSENLTDDANAQLYVTKFATIALYLTKFFVT